MGMDVNKRNMISPLGMVAFAPSGSSTPYLGCGRWISTQKVIDAQKGDARGPNDARHKTIFEPWYPQGEAEDCHVRLLSPRTVLRRCYPMVAWAPSADAPLAG